MLTLYIRGTAETEHLRAEVRGDDVVLVSHERMVTPMAEGENRCWHDRNLGTVPAPTWKTLARLMGLLQDAGLADRIILAAYCKWSEDTYRAEFMSATPDIVQQFRQWFHKQPFHPPAPSENYEIEMIREFHKQEGES